MRYVFEKTGNITLPCVGRRKVTLSVRSNGCMVTGSLDETPVVLFCGEAAKKISGVIDKDFLKVTVPPDGLAVVEVYENRQPWEDVEWIGGESFVDLEPRPVVQIAPEVQAVIDRMNRNAIIREQALLRSLGQRG